MIRNIDDNTWAWFCNISKLGTYLGSTQLDESIVEESEDEFSFSTAQTMVKVGLINNQELYYIFSNEGIINAITPAGKMLIDPNNQSDYELYKTMPELAAINMKFYGMMEHQ